jgi:hypothetical protein
VASPERGSARSSRQLQTPLPMAGLFWDLHRSLITTCSVRAWTLALETGDLKAADAFGGNYDRRIRHVEVTGPMVQDISWVCIVAGRGPDLADLSDAAELSRPETSPRRARDMCASASGGRTRCHHQNVSLDTHTIGGIETRSACRLVT